MPFDLAPLQAAWVAVALFGAAYVRGYSGFGYAALVLSGVSLVTDPRLFIGVVVLTDIGMTLGQLRGIWPHIDRRRVLALFAGALAGVPIGLHVVGLLGVDPARIALSLTILVMSGALMIGWHLRRDPPLPAHAGVGVLSGLAQGIGVGGLPVAAWFAAQTLPAATFRATIIAYFCLLDTWTLPNLWWQGGVTGDTILASLYAAPVLTLGLVLGGRRFHSASPDSFRRFAIVLLAGLALLGLIRALL